MLITLMFTIQLGEAMRQKVGQARTEQDSNLEIGGDECGSGALDHSCLPYKSSFL